MITLKDYLEAIDYKIAGGSEYGWKCFGDNARYLDCHDSEGFGGKYSIHCIFDAVDQTVYSLELWDYANDREYRWIHSGYIKKHMKACAKHDVDAWESIDTRNFIDLDLASDILEKIAAVVAGEPYDTRVQIQVDIPDEDMLQYMKLAHKMDITFNEFVEQALRHAIDEVEAGRLTKEDARKFIDEEYSEI